MERFGVPVVDEVEEVALERVRRVPWPNCCGGGYCDAYCDDCIVLAGGVYVVGEAEEAKGKTPEEVVRVREWPLVCEYESGPRCE